MLFYTKYSLHVLNKITRKTTHALYKLFNSKFVSRLKKLKLFLFKYAMNNCMPGLNYLTCRVRSEWSACFFT